MTANTNRIIELFDQISKFGQMSINALLCFSKCLINKKKDSVSLTHSLKLIKSIVRCRSYLLP